MENLEILNQYRELDLDCARLARHQFDENAEDKGIFIPDEENMAKAWDTFRTLKERTAALEEPDAVFSMVKHHLEDFLESQEYELEDTQKYPEACYLRMHWEVENISRLNRKPDEERCEELVRRFKELTEHKDIFLELIRKQHDADAQQETAGALLREKFDLEEAGRKLKVYYPSFTEEQYQRADQAISDFCRTLEDMAGALSREDVPAKAPEADDLSLTVKMDEAAYRTLLKKKLGVSLDELLEWHKEEIEKTRSEVFAIAAGLDIPEPAPKTMREVNDILFKYEGPCDTPEEMLSRANEYLKRTRALAHEFVSLPEDEICRCLPVPDCCKDSYPWGGYEGGDFSIRPFEGQMFLNHHNYRNVTDGWIKLNSLHEAYPGHHVQYVRAEIDETPETVKIGAKLVPLLEGTCLRTERAFEFIFGEDPFFPLFVAYRRHHASVRIYVDLMMFYYGATLEDVVKIYEEELGFERGTARKQVRAHQNGPGYFTCYYYGMKKICEWEKEYGFSKKDFTELLFSAGYISIDRFGELVKLSPKDRERYFHDFSSLLKERKTKEK